MIIEKWFLRNKNICYFFISSFVFNYHIIKINIESSINKLKKRIEQGEIEEENNHRTRNAYLESYYDQTQEQAKKGFYMTEFVFFLGMIILFVGIIAMFLNFTKPAHVAIVLGSITEFISAIFFYLYNKTVTNM